MSSRKNKPISGGAEPNEPFEGYDNYAHPKDNEESVTSSSGSESYDSDSDSSTASSSSSKSSSSAGESSTKSSSSSTSSGSTSSESTSSSSSSSGSSSEPSYDDGIYDQSEAVYEDDDVSSLQGEESTYGGDSSRMSAPETASGSSPQQYSESPITNHSTYDSRVELTIPREEDEYEESGCLGDSNPFEDSGRDSAGAPSPNQESPNQDPARYSARDSTEGSRDYEEKDSFVSEQRYASPIVATSAAVPEPVMEESQDGHVSKDDNESSSGSSSASYSDSNGIGSGSTYGSSYSGSSSGSSYTSTSMDVPDSVTALTSEGHGGSHSVDSTSSVSTSVSGSSTSSSSSSSSNGSSSGSESASGDDSNRDEPRVYTSAIPVASSDNENEEPQAIEQPSRDLSPENVKFIEESESESSYGSSVDSQREVPAVGEPADLLSASFVKDEPEAIGEASELESSYRRSEISSQQNLAAVGVESGESASFAHEEPISTATGELEAIGEESASLNSETSESSDENGSSGSDSSESYTGNESGSSYRSSIDSQREVPIVGQAVTPDMNVNEQHMPNATKEPQATYEENELPSFDSGESSEESGSVSTGSDVSEQEMAVVGPAAFPMAKNISNTETVMPDVTDRKSVV